MYLYVNLYMYVLVCVCICTHVHRWAALERKIWPPGLAKAMKFHKYGDRRNKIVVIGHHMDHDAVRAKLDACTLDDAEFAQGQAWWNSLPDPWKEQWAQLEEEGLKTKIKEAGDKIKTLKAEKRPKDDPELVTALAKLTAAKAELADHDHQHHPHAQKNKQKKRNSEDQKVWDEFMKELKAKRQRTKNRG